MQSEVNGVDALSIAPKARPDPNAKVRVPNMIARFRSCCLTYNRYVIRILAPEQPEQSEADFDDA
jgi:hypothetical protein